MKMPRFFEGVLFALLVSALATVCFGAAQLIFPAGFLWRLLMAAVTLAYLLYLLSRSGEHVGRITTVLIWCAVTAVIWLADLPIVLFALSQLAAIWLVRSLYFHTQLLTVAGDCILNGIAFSAGVWSYCHAGSLFLGLWSFFLVQALFVLIPQLSAIPAQAGSQDRDVNFQQAYRTAESALRRLSSIH